jgi:hypothetical protein
MDLQLPTKLLDWIDIDKLNHTGLSYNSHPEALKFFKKNPDKINWDGLSKNLHPEALKLLRENPDKIN